MDELAKIAQVGADDFARRFSLRAANLMWLLGAGASASAGIPTASDMVWEFKQQLFISQRRVSQTSVADLSSPAIRSQLQAHIDSLKTMPSPGDADEYAALFEAAYPAEQDRRIYVDAKVKGAKPSYGHLALATLMRAGLSKIAWTTNFDSLVADGCAKVYDGTGALTTVALDAPDLASQSIGDGRWPIEIKLHGDFRSRRLKNTNDELRHQDERLRQVLIESCHRFGLVVAGYSGRDSSVMDALSQAVAQPGAFPSGLFWLHRGEEPPFARVEELLTLAEKAGVESALVRVENFDEVMRDLVRIAKGIDTSVLQSYATDRRRWSAAPNPQGNKGWPVVRLNALPVILSPTVCRRVVCTIGGYAEARAAVGLAGVDLPVARVRAGVLIYGTDADVRKALSPHGITEFDLHTIETKRLRYDSGERGLMREALTHAICRERKLTSIRRSSSDLLIPVNVQDEIGKLSVVSSESSAERFRGFQSYSGLRGSVHVSTGRTIVSGC